MQDSSYAYEIYKREVGGKTWDGKPIKPFSEMPDHIKKAWSAIDKAYKDENLIRSIENDHKNY